MFLKFPFWRLAAWSGKKVVGVGLKRAQDFIRSATDSCSLGPRCNYWAAGRLQGRRMKSLGGVTMEQEQACTVVHIHNPEQLTIIKITGMIFHPGNEITTKITWAVDGSVHIKVNGVEMYPSKKETRKG